MQHLRGTLVNYPWGTFDVIPTLLGEEPDGRPVAEFWLGAHPLSGPVVLELAPEHGVHLTDPLALVPFALGVSCLWRARGVWIQRSESVS